MWLSSYNGVYFVCYLILWAGHGALYIHQQKYAIRHNFNIYLYIITMVIYTTYKFKMEIKLPTLHNGSVGNDRIQSILHVLKKGLCITVLNIWIYRLRFLCWISCLGFFWDINKLNLCSIQWKAIKLFSLFFSPFNWTLMYFPLWLLYKPAI